MCIPFYKPAPICSTFQWCNRDSFARGFFRTQQELKLLNTQNDLCCGSPQLAAQEDVKSTRAWTMSVPLFAVQQSCFFWMATGIWFGPGSVSSSLLWVSGYYEEKTSCRASSYKGEFGLISWSTDIGRFFNWNGQICDTCWGFLTD